MKVIAIYATDEQGNWTDPDTGKCWNIGDDRAFFREEIKDQVIICGRKTYEADWKGFAEADKVIVLSKSLKVEADYKLPQTSFKTTPADAFTLACNYVVNRKIYIVGGKEIFDIYYKLIDEFIHTIVGKNGQYTRNISFANTKQKWIKDAGSATKTEDGHCTACEL